MQTRHLAVLALLAVLAVPTAAVTVAESATPSDEVTWGGPSVTLQASQGPNGQYASIDEEGEIEVAFDRLNDEAVTRADDVLTIEASGNQSVLVWVTSQTSGVELYRSDGGNFGQANAVKLAPNESASVGFEVDTRGANPSAGTFRVHAATAPKGESNIVVTEVDAPQEATENQSTPMGLTVVNLGDRSGTRTIEFKVGDDVVIKRTVRLEPGESRRLTFEYTFGGRDVYTLSENETTVGEVSVRAPDPPSTRSLPNSFDTTAAGSWALWLAVMAGAGRYRRKVGQLVWSLLY